MVQCDMILQQSFVGEKNTHISSFVVDYMKHVCMYLARLNDELYSKYHYTVHANASEKNSVSR